MDTSDTIQTIIGIATLMSVILIWLSTKANNERRKKELTVQYTDVHNANVECLLSSIYKNRLNGKLDLDKVIKDEILLSTVEKYLFAMERLAVGINTNVFDIHVFDRIMGQKTIEHYEALEVYIEYVRKKDYLAKYSEYECLTEELRKIRKKRFPKPENSTKGNIRKFWG